MVGLLGGGGVLEGEVFGGGGVRQTGSWGRGARDSKGGDKEGEVVVGPEGDSKGGGGRERGEGK